MNAGLRPSFKKRPAGSGRKIYWFVGLCVTVAVISTYRLQPRLFRLIDYNIYDRYATHFIPALRSDKTAVIDIDERALNRYGQWPWPRYLLGKLIRTLYDFYHSGALGIDILMSETDRTSLKVIEGEFRNLLGQSFSIKGLGAQYYDNDTFLARAIRDTPTVLGYFFTFPSQTEAIGHFAATHKACPVRRPNVPIVDDSRSGRPSADFVQTASGLICPLPVLLAAAKNHAFYNALPDEDGAIRRAPLIIRFDGAIYPSLALATYMEAEGLDDFSVFTDENGAAGLQVGDLHVPTDAFGNLTLTFKGGGHTFAHYSAGDVLDHKIPREDLEGRVLFLGSSAIGLKDIRSTPFGADYPGVEAHAVVVDNLYTRTFTHTPNWVPGMQIVLQALVGLLSTWALSFSPSAAMFAALLVILGSSVTYTSFEVFIHNRIFVSPLYPFLILLGNALTITLLRFWREEKQKKFLRKAFSHYLSGDVIAQMEADGRPVTLKGEEKHVSVLFSDIRGFTALSEGLSPQEVVTLLNRYLTPMTALVKKHKGTLDKFIGDAMMAFWNAPAEVPHHGLYAVLAALEMHEALAILNTDVFLPSFRRRLQIGVGIHTGIARVGNMGSDDLMDYTVLGDTVNAASRIESLCKFYHQPVIVSDTTRGVSLSSQDALGQGPADRLAFLPLDRVRVMGKQETLGLYVPLRETMLPSRKNFIEPYEHALNLYTEGHFAESLTFFEILLKIHPANPFFALYTERCRQFLQTPPEAWDGVYTHTAK